MNDNFEGFINAHCTGAHCAVCRALINGRRFREAIGRVYGVSVIDWACPQGVPWKAEGIDWPRINDVVIPKTRSVASCIYMQDTSKPAPERRCGSHEIICHNPDVIAAMGGEEGRRIELEKTGRFPQGWSVKMCNEGKCRYFVGKKE